MIVRSEWISALTAHPVETLLSLTAALSSDWLIRPKSVPQAGLGMLKLKDSAFNEPFFLGEFPLSSAWIEIQTREGSIAEGAAQVMDDRVELAEALALCDAVLSARLPGWEQVNTLLEQGKERRLAIARERKHMLASTQVDFSLLDDVADEDDDDAY